MAADRFLSTESSGAISSADNDQDSSLQSSSSGSSSSGSSGSSSGADAFSALLAAAVRRVEQEDGVGFGLFSQHHDQNVGRGSQCKVHQCSYVGCAYASKKRSHLTQHVRSVHEGVRYPCEVPSCPYSATRKSYLKFHMKKVHRNGKTNLKKLKQSLAARKGALTARQRKFSSRPPPHAVGASSRQWPMPLLPVTMSCLSPSAQLSTSGNDIARAGGTCGSLQLSLETQSVLREENLPNLARVKRNSRGELDFELDKNDADATADYDDDAIRELLAGFGVFPPDGGETVSAATASSCGDGDDDDGLGELPPIGDLGDWLPPVGDLGAELPFGGGVGDLNLLPPLDDKMLSVATNAVPTPKPACSVSSERVVRESTSSSTIQREPKQELNTSRQNNSEKIQRALFTAPENVFQAARAYYHAKKEAREAIDLAKRGKFARGSMELMVLAKRVAESARMFFELRQKEQGIPRNAGELGFEVAMGFILQNEAKIRGKIKQQAQQHEEDKKAPDCVQSCDSPTTQSACKLTPANPCPSQNVDRVECGASGDSVRCSSQMLSCTAA